MSFGTPSGVPTVHEGVYTVIYNVRSLIRRQHGVCEIFALANRIAMSEFGTDHDTMGETRVYSEQVIHLWSYGAAVKPSVPS